MYKNPEYESKVKKELLLALKREGLLKPTNMADKLQREGFEEGFLLGRLEELMGRWHDMRISQLDFQQKALTLHAMLTRLENDPERFSWLRRKYRSKQESITDPDSATVS